MLDPIQKSPSSWAANSKNGTANTALNHGADSAQRGQAAASDVKVSLSSQNPVSGFDGDQVQSVVLASVERRLAQARANGASEQEIEKLKDQALKGAAKGFQEAKDIIRGLGRMTPEMEDKIDMTLANMQQAIQDEDFSLVDKNSSNDLPVAASSQQLVSKGYLRTQQSLSLQLQTASGKGIDINISQNKELLSGLKQNGNQLLSQWQMQSAGAISFSVQGDLTEQEKEAIGMLIGQVGQIAEKFFNGDLDEAFKLAQELELDDEQLVAMSLSMRKEQTRAASLYQQQAPSLPKALAPVSDFARSLEDLRQQAISNQVQPDLSAIRELFSLHPQASDNRMSILDRLAAPIWGVSSE